MTFHRETGSSRAKSTTAGVRSVRFLLVAALSAAACLAVAAPAALAIHDEDAFPNLRATIAHQGNDRAGDVLISGGYVWVAGQVDDGAGGSDASLTRVALEQSGVPSTQYVQRLYTAGVTAARYLAAGAEGVMYTAGYQRTAAGYDFCVIKWSKTGSPIWKRPYDGPMKGFDTVSDVAADRFGNVVVCGESQSASGTDWAVVSWSSNGARRWVWRYDGAAHQDDRPTELLVDRGGNTYVTGIVNAATDTNVAFTVKLSPGGKKLWTRKYAGSDGVGARARCLTPAPGGGVIVAGDYTRTMGGVRDMAVRYSSAGSARVFGPGIFMDDAPSSSVNDIVVTTGGWVTGVGWTNQYGSLDRWEVDWLSDGSTRAGHSRITGFADQYLYVTKDPFGARCIAGTEATGDGQTSIYTERWDPAGGGAFWSLADDMGLTGAHVPSGIAAKNNIVATAGTIDRGGGDYDQLVEIWRY